ncbi:MAG: glycosyltransferase family 4 protein [Vicinamibacterales bacterium]
MSGLPALSFVVPGSLDTPTGGYAYDRRIVEGLRDRGWRVTVRELAGDYPMPDAAARARAAALFATLDDGALVVADGLALGALPDETAPHAARLRLVALVHHPLGLETGLPAEVAAALVASERAALAMARAVVVTSPATAAGLDAFGVPADCVTVVEPGTDPAPPARGTRRADPHAEVHLLCVASLVPRKGHQLLVEALHALRERRWRLTCIGSLTLHPETAAGIRALAAARGLADRIAFTGALHGAALAAAYHAADAFVLPSHYEGYGMAVAEAVARGLPVVATRTGAAPALVDDASGVLVAPGDLDGFTAALDRVVADDVYRDALAAGAARRAALLPTWPDAAAAFADALQRVADGDVQR